MPIGQGDPNAGVDERHIAADVERFGDHIDQPVGDESALGLGHQVFADQHELVTTEARHGIDFPHDRRDSLGTIHQQGVPGGVTEGVIDALELVEIQEHDRDAVSVPPCPLQCSLDLLHQGSAVVQARQGVMVGSPQQFRLSLLALGDVLDRQDAAAGAHGAVEQGRAESRAAGCAHGGIRGTPVLALSDRIAEIGQGVIQAVGGHEQTFQGRFLDRVLRHCQHGLGHLVDIKNDTLPIHDDESRCGSVEDGSEPVALHGGRRLAGLLETVVQGLHLSGCQQEGPVMQVTLLLGLLIRR